MKAILTLALAGILCVVAVAQDKKTEQEKKAEPVGTWKCEYDLGGEKRECTLTLKKDGDKLVGTMKWPEQAEAKLTDVKVKDAEVTFTGVREFMDLKFTMKYTLKVDGDKIKGKVDTEFQGEAYSFDIEGKREKAVEAKDAKKGKGK